MLIQNLLDIYNFLPVPQTPLLQVEFHKVDNFPPIQQMLYRICQFSDHQQSNQDVSQNYRLLNQCNSFLIRKKLSVKRKKVQDQKGLRDQLRVCLLQSCNIMKLLNVLRQQSQQSSNVYFHLTYYRKNCLKYVDAFSSCCMMMLGLIAGYNLQQWMGIEEKIKQAIGGIKELSRIEEHYGISIVLNRLCSLIGAIATYQLNNMKKAKDLCSKIINTSSIESISAIKCHKQPTTIIKLQLTLCSYTVMRIYQHMGNYELSMFMMNKFLEYAQRFYQGGERFVKVVGKGEMREKEVRVRLTRLEEKIRRIDLTEEEEENKYRTTNKSNKTINTLSRASSLHTIHQHSTMAKTLSNFNLTRTKHIFSVHKQANAITSQMQSIQNSQKAIASLKESMVKKKQNSTNKLKLTRRGINPQITTSNGFRSNLGRSCSMQFLHSGNNTPSRASQQQQLASTINKKQPLIIKTTKHQQQLNNAKQQQSQLQNLLIVKPQKRNSYRLKQQTLKFLSKQSNQLKKMIRSKNNEINKLQSVKTNLAENLNLDGLRGNIQQSKIRQRELMRQISSNKWSYLSSLPQIKKIAFYFKTMVAIQAYGHKKKVHQMVYGNMLNVPQMRMLAVFRQRAEKRSKQIITQVVYKNIKHQVEYIKKQLPGHNNQFLYFINIYQTQKGHEGINLQQQLSPEQYNLVKYEPFYFNFSFYQGQLIPFRKQLLGLGLRSIYYVNKLVRKIRRNWLKLQNKLRYKRLEVGFNYQYGTVVVRKDNLVDKEKIEGNKFVFVSVYLLTARQIPQQHQHHHQQIDLQILNKKSFKISHQNIPSSNQLCEPFVGIRKITSTSSISNKKLLSNSIQKQFQVILQTVSDDKFHNKDFNVRISHKFIAHQIDLDNELQLIRNTITKQMDQIFRKYLPQIVKIQYFIKKSLAKKKLQSRKKQFHVETFLNKSVLCTLVVNKTTKKAKFFIESILKPEKPNRRKNRNIFSISQSFQSLDIHRCPLLIRNDPPFQNLQFLSQFKTRLSQSQNFQEMYTKIQKIMKIRMLAKEIVSKKNEIKLFTDFQAQFRKRLCFATIKQEFLFRGKMREGRIMYMLTVKEFSKVPRPYSIRIFTLDPSAMISIDGQKIIYNKEKIFLESKLQTVNEVIDIFGRNEFEIQTKSKGDSMTKKPAARISILSGYSFKNGEPNRDHFEEKGSSNGTNRRLSRVSMFTKFRHKAMMKTQDLQALKKFFQQRNPNQLLYSQSKHSQHTGKLSLVQPVISSPSQDQSSDSKGDKFKHIKD